MKNDIESGLLGVWGTSSRGVAAIPLDILSELARATTAYHEAAPDRVEYARVVYEEALRKFRATAKPARPATFSAGG